MEFTMRQAMHRSYVLGLAQPWNYKRLMLDNWIEVGFVFNSIQAGAPFNSIKTEFAFNMIQIGVQ